VPKMHEKLGDGKKLNFKIFLQLMGVWNLAEREFLSCTGEEMKRRVKVKEGPLVSKGMNLPGFEGQFHGGKKSKNGK